VLVHCQQGVSRSCAVVTAYLMAQNGRSVVEALEYVQKRRPQAQPNIGFMAQLQDFYDSLTGRSKYDRAALKQGLVLLLRNVEQRTDAELTAALTPYGEIFRIERYDGGKLSMVCFGSRHARRWAEAALVADSELRGKIPNSRKRRRSSCACLALPRPVPQRRQQAAVDERMRQTQRLGP
jgi:hypothetical protein